MSLGTGVLIVEREPEHHRHSREVSMATLRAGTTPACSHQMAPSHWKTSVENIHLTPYLPTYKPKKGREEVLARIHKDSNKKNRSAKISSKCQQEMQRKSQDKQCIVHMHLLEGGDLRARRFFWFYFLLCPKKVARGHTHSAPGTKWQSLSGRKTTIWTRYI